MTNILYSTSLGALGGASSVASAYTQIYKYFRVTRFEVKLVPQWNPIYNTNFSAGGNPQVDIMRMYASRIELETEPDSPDTVSEMVNSSYGRLHLLGKGCRRVCIPRLLEQDTDFGGTSGTALGVAAVRKWYLTNSSVSSLFGGVNVLFPINTQVVKYSVWTKTTVEFKTRINK